MNVGRDTRVRCVLDVAPVYPERGESLLGMGGEHRGQIDGAGPFGPVEAPNGLGDQRVHVHRFRAVAPARRDRDREADPRPGELVRGLGRLGHAADARVRDDALHGLAVGVAEVGREEAGYRLRQGHRLAFQRLPDAVAAAIDRGTDADPREIWNGRRCHVLKPPAAGR